MNVTATLRLDFQGAQQMDVGNASPYLQWLNQLDNGTDEDEIDLLYAKQVTITNNATPLSLNLYDGSLLGIDNSACAFREVVSFFAVNRTTTGAGTPTEATVTFGGGATPWTQAFTGFILGPSVDPVNMPSWFGMHNQSNPAWTVTNTNKLLQLVTSSGSTNTPVTLFIAGRSA